MHVSVLVSGGVLPNILKPSSAEQMKFKYSQIHLESFSLLVLDSRRLELTPGVSYALFLKASRTCIITGSAVRLSPSDTVETFLHEHRVRLPRRRCGVVMIQTQC